MDDTDEELHGMVLSIVNEIEAAAEGRLYKNDGEFEIIDDEDEWRRCSYEQKVDAFRGVYKDFDYDKSRFKSFDEYVESECGTADDIELPEKVCLSEYIYGQSLGDVHFEVGSRKQLFGGKVLFTFGGPNIWAYDDAVRGYWGRNRVEISLNESARNAMYEWLEEEWDTVG